MEKLLLILRFGDLYNAAIPISQNPAISIKYGLSLRISSPKEISKSQNPAISNKRCSNDVVKKHGYQHLLVIYKTTDKFMTQIKC
jgi:hypothetical protein